MEQGCLTERHLQLFGAIIRWFAEYERLMLEVMASIMGADSASVSLIARGLDFERKRRALFDLLRDRAIPLDQYDRIVSYLRLPHGLTGLRNDIAHSAWVAVQHANGIQPNWILRPQPSIKAISAEPETEFADAKVEYTIDDLMEIEHGLAINHAEFLAYLRKNFLIGQPSVFNARRE